MQQRQHRSGNSVGQQKPNGNMQNNVQRKPSSRGNGSAVNPRANGLNKPVSKNTKTQRKAVRPANTAKVNAKPKSDVVPNATAKTAPNPNRVRFWNVKGRVDVPMLVIVLVLLTFGITMMFSAGHAWAYEKNSDPFYYVTHQLPAAGLGLLGMIALAVFDYRFLRREFKLGKHKFTISHILLVGMLFLNFLCIPFGVSNIVNGPKRWLKIPVFGTFQPSDFLKVAVIVFMAYYIHKNSDKIRSFAVGLLKPALLFCVIILIMMGQSHLSGLLIIFMVAAVMLFVGGVNIKPALIALPIAALAIFIAVELSDFVYYFDRITYMDPLSEPWDRSYQNYQSALAVGSGGIWGKGFGNSSQKYFYLPEAPNDFVYAILVEEFGLVGGAMVILMFLLFVMRGFQIARCAEDKFGCLIVTGITFQIGLQALLNIGVNLCCIPNTGISLPFFSYGGTALMIQLWEIGLLLSVSKRAKLK